MENSDPFSNIPKTNSDTEVSSEMEELKRDVLDNIIYPSLKEDTHLILQNLRKYDTKINIFTFLKYLCLISSPIVLSLGTVFIGNVFVNFTGSALSMLGLSFDKVASYLENKKNDDVQKLNHILINLGVKKNIYDFDDIKKSFQKK